MTQNRAFPYILLFPALLISIAVSIYPTYFAIDISLYKTAYLKKVEFVGLSNYLQLLSDPTFLDAIVATLKFGVGSIIFIIPLGMMFAVLLNQPIRFKSAFRTILILPWALSQSVTAMLWMWMLNPSYGPVKYVLSELGKPDALFLSNPSLAIWIVTAVNAWMSYPLPMVLFLAALQTVPGELHEAAKIDGCSAWGRFRHVVLPWIKGTVMTTTIVMTLQVFNMVTLIYVMTGGGPLGTTRTLSVMVFLDGFFNFRLAAAAAVGMVIFLLNILFSLSYIRVLRQSHLER